ncbi:eCIS core domain-containing protein [Kribbella ginsengisoli]|uniref:DUF4157 domain-containing protein n=1 Tax=Kribbella ginsengisoli TaxID=363865 RepID=A0ABP6VJM6_9ACTN
MNRTRSAPISEPDEAEREPGRSGPVESGPEPAAARMGNAAYARVVESHPPARGDLGTPLDPEVRSWANQAFGSDLSAVRVHTGSTAEQANREAGTSAYTVGSHIVLGSDNFPLLVHELAHSVQQERGRGLSPGRPAAANEGLADRAVEGALTGRRSVDVGPGAPVGLAGGDESKEEGLSRRLLRQLQTRLVNQVMGSLGVQSTASDLVQYAVIGFVEELIAQLWTGTKGIDFLKAMLRMSAGDVAQLVKGYYAGLVLGVISPITDLFSLAVLAEKLALLGPRILASVLTNPGGLAADAQAVATKVGAIGTQVGVAWEAAKHDPAATIVGILEAQGNLAEFAKQQARSLGKAGATAVVDSLTGPVLPQPAGKPAEASGFMGAVEWAESKWKGGEAAVLNTPWAQIGGKLGYAVGFVAVQIALLLFTSGVGNAVEQVAAGVAKVAVALERVSKGAGMVVGRAAELAATVGKAIGAVEMLLGAAMSKVLKPLEKILGPILQPFEEAMAALKTFLENLLGVAKKQAAPAVEAAAGKAAATLTDDALRATPKPPAKSLPSKASEALEHPPTAATPEPTTAAELPKTPEPVKPSEPTKTPDAPEPVKAPEPPEPVKAPDAAEPLTTPEPVKKPEPPEPAAAPKTEAVEPPVATAPEATPAEPMTTAAPAPQPAAAPPETSKPKTTKPKKSPEPTGDPEMDALLARIETDVPAELTKPVKKVARRIRKQAKSDPDGARRLAEDADAKVESLRTEVDEDLELLSGRSDPAEADQAIAGELDAATVAMQKSDEAAVRRRAKAKAAGQPILKPFEQRVQFGALENGRPTGVMGELHPSDLRTGSATGVYKPPGLEGSTGQRPHLGHLLGNQFGGSGTDPRNLVWMHQKVNLSKYKLEFEHVLRKALRNGETVTFGITPLYRGSEKAPYAVEVWMTGTKTVMPRKIVPTIGVPDL